VIEWKPFLLRPDMPESGMDLPQDYKADMEDTRRRLVSVANDGGLPMVFSDHIPNSRLALEATEYAAVRGKGEEFHRAVFARLYGEGKDISRWDVLREAALEAGLDPDDMQTQIEGGGFRETVKAQAAAARELGIHAVPTYVINGKYRIVGAQPYEVFREAIREIVSR
jgi:predicted DsbA family dithiol-disulfide isomerase